MRKIFTSGSVEIILRTSSYLSSPMSGGKKDGLGVRGLSRVGGRPGGLGQVSGGRWRHLGGGARGRVSRGGRVMRWEEGWAYPTLSMGGLGGLGQ